MQKKNWLDIVGSLYSRNFRYFWFGQCISLLGTWMQRTAQLWLVYTLTNSPLYVGLVGVCQFAPVFTFSLFVGPFIEHTSKRKILIYTQSLFMLQSICLMVLTYFHWIRYVHILFLSLFFGILQTFDTPARQSFLHELVELPDLMNAVSLNSTSFNLARILGPAVSGFIMGTYGISFCFLLNALSFLAVLLGLFHIHTREQLEKATMDGPTSLLDEVKDGITYIFHKVTLRLNIIFMAIVCTFAMNTEIIIPIFTREVLHGDEMIYTSLMSAAGFGALLGALFMAMRAKKGINNRLFFFSIFSIAILQIALFFIKSYPLALLFIAATGFCHLVFMNMNNSTFQLGTDNGYRGRVMSVYAFINQGSTPIGNAFAGSFMEIFGGIWGFPGCGIATLGLILCTVILQKDHLRTWLALK